MAGKRREANKAQVRAIRPARRRSALNTRLAQAHTPRDRVAIAADYFRGALALNPNATEAEALVEALVQAGDRLYGKEGTNR